jgi:hypothetical protein
MIVDYDRARELIEEKLRPVWSHGTFCIDDRQISETDEYYAFVVGAREFLVDGDSSFEIIGALNVVYKADGRVDSLPSVDVAMDPTARTRPNPNPTFEETSDSPS